MRNLSLPKLFLTAMIATTLLQSCKDDSYLLNTPAMENQSFSEQFDSSGAAISRGWVLLNGSYPKGGGVWQNGGDVLNTIFNAYEQQGTYAGFIGATANSTRTPTALDAAPYALATPAAPQGFVNNWLISPPTLMQNGDKIIFYTRSQVLNAGGGDSTDFGNRLEVRINKHGTDTYVGDIKKYWQWLYTTTSTQAEDDAGNFDVVLLDINTNNYEWHKNTPTTSVIDGRTFTSATNFLAYPVRWTRFEATVSGLSTPTKGRFAFRYFVPGGDPNNGYATGVGIDKVEFKTSGY
jgi:hypothetical protein